MAYALLAVLLLCGWFLWRVERGSGAELPRTTVGLFLGVGTVLLAAILFFSVGRAGSEPRDPAV